MKRSNATDPSKPKPPEPLSTPGVSRSVLLRRLGQPHGIAPTVLPQDHQLAHFTVDDLAVVALDGDHVEVDSIGQRSAQAR